jgi:hypothetical protein
MVGVAVHVGAIVRVAVLVGDGPGVLVPVGVRVGGGAVGTGVLELVAVALGGAGGVGAGVRLIVHASGCQPSPSMVRAERILMVMPFGTNALTNGTMNWYL